MAHQSLYRRYRPRRFDEVRGQDHVVSALRNAVANQTEGHAYLFSGPRGTGKTSTARILAKALNCENLQGGEPCCECSSCEEMEAGRSFDLFELDAASNNGVDAVRDLVERAAVGSPGRTKVYILDEVHMLSAGASNALLKTLEEPPEHVRFVLATTDPQKVLPTIRSRTQHFEFQLLAADELERQVRSIAADAELDVDDGAVAWVVQKGRGSSRDTLSALDQVVAAGGVVERAEPVERLYAAIASSDTGTAIVAVAEALSQGHDPRVLGAAFLDSLRDSFLVSLGVDVPHLVAHDRRRHDEWAGALGTATLTRAMEAVGSALVDMRQAADPRVPLEVALVRLTSPVGGDASLAELTERLDRLERRLSTATVGPAPAGADPAAASSAAAPEPATPASTDRDGAPGEPTPTTAGSASGPAQARAALAKLRSRDGEDDARSASAAPPAGAPSAPTPPVPPTPPPSTSAAPTPAAPTPTAEDPAPAEPAEPAEPAAPPEPRVEAAAASAAPSGSANGSPSLEQVAVAVSDAVVPALKGVAKALYGGGRVVSVDGGTVIFGLAPNTPIDRAERSRAEVESLLGSHLGTAVSVRLVEDVDTAGDGSAGAPRISGGAVDLTEPDEIIDLGESLGIDVDELEDANDIAVSGVDRLREAFPGAVVVDESEV